MRRFVTTPLVCVALLLGLASCSSAPSASTVEISERTIVIDVRTANEYAAGHLEGARLLDINSGEFVAALPNLDPDAEYLIYCRSGNRSGQAIVLMERAGFTNVTNLGSLRQAADATKLAIVK